MQTPWKTDKWFISPWTYLPEITKKYNFAPKIKIHDVTLRDGEQQTAVVFRREEKVAIAKQLDALGVHRIESGMPAVSDQDKAAIQDIAALGLKSEIFAFARCIPEEIKVVKACGCKGVVIEIPASDHMIKNAYGWTFDRAAERANSNALTGFGWIWSSYTSDFRGSRNGLEASTLRELVRTHRARLTTASMRSCSFWILADLSRPCTLRPPAWDVLRKSPSG